MTSRFIRPLLCGGLLAFAVLIPVSVLAAPVSFSCNPAKVKGSASALTPSTRFSTTFGNIPETQVTFTQGGTSASCVIVRFSAGTEADGAQYLFVRAVLDNSVVALPDEILYSTDDGGVSRAHSFEFIFPSVGPGLHTVRMQYRSGAGGAVSVLKHNTVVQFAP